MPAQLISFTPSQVNVVGSAGNTYVFPGDHRVVLQLDRSHPGFDVYMATYKGIQKWVDAFKDKEPLHYLENYEEAFHCAIANNENGMGDLFPRDRALSIMEHAITLPWLERQSRLMNFAEAEEDAPLDWEANYNFDTLLDLVELLAEIPYERQKLQDTYVEPPFEWMIENIDFNENMFPGLKLSPRAVAVLKANAIVILNAAVVEFTPMFQMTFAGFGSKDNESKFQHLNFGGRLGYLNLFKSEALEPNNKVIETSYSPEFSQLEQAAAALLKSPALKDVPQTEILKPLVESTNEFDWEDSYFDLAIVEITKQQVKQRTDPEY